MGRERVDDERGRKAVVGFVGVWCAGWIRRADPPVAACFEIFPRRMRGLTSYTGPKDPIDTSELMGKKKGSQIMAVVTIETTLDHDGQQNHDEDDPSLLLFAEREEAFHCIERFAISDDDDEPCDDQDKLTALLRLRVIFDKYQECQVLLDASLEEMIQALCRYRNSPYALSALYGLAKVRGYKTIQRFLPHAIADVHDVWSRLQKRPLQRLDGEQERADSDDPVGDDADHQENPPRPAAPSVTTTACGDDWEGQYVLWLWMAALSLVPFDSTVLWGDDGANVFGHELLQAAISQFTNPGLLREAAAYCLAHWLSRPDGQILIRPRFLAWAQATVESYVNDDGRDPPPHHHHEYHHDDNDHGMGNNVVVGAAQRQGDRQFQVLAILQTAVTLLKRHDPATVVDTMRGWCGIMQHLADYVDNGNNKKNKKNVASSSSSALLQRYLIKWWTRWSCALLPPPCAWRYRPGQRSLFGNSSKNNGSSNNNAIVTPSNAPPPDPSAEQGQQQQSDNDDDIRVLPLVPNEVEQNMGRLLQLMSHAATAVRWSAAKGIGRITERLPQLCARDVLDAILASVADDDYHSDAAGHYRSANDDDHAADDTAWHGACLTLAELARRGLILPSWLPDVVPYLVRALQLERPSRHSAGAGVRDAACYTYWAFARAYRPIDLQPFLPELNEAIVLMSLFDRHVNCRRAASAAFQEAVGRQGATNVPHGLDILTVADYFTLGNLTNAYLLVAKNIAMLNNSPYRRSILRHLYTSKLYHWDSVRFLFLRYGTESHVAGRLTELYSQFRVKLVRTFVQ
jgi:tubulin-specific chaperone D